MKNILSVADFVIPEITVKKSIMGSIASRMKAKKFQVQLCDPGSDRCSLAPGPALTDLHIPLILAVPCDICDTRSPVKSYRFLPIRNI